MIFNMTAGRNPGLEIISGSYADLSGDQVLDIPLTVNPLMIALKTSAGGSSELALYCRAKPEDQLTLKTGGGCAAQTRVYSVQDTAVIAALSGAGTANPARVEYYVLGVRKE